MFEDLAAMAGWKSTSFNPSLPW